MTTDRGGTGSKYKNYLLIVLLLIYAFNFVDRFALGLVVDSIKVDLHLSDSEVGFLSGIAFALFYSLMGIPIARWADRGNRVTIITITAALWSLMVALCGKATSFTQLLLIRIGVGIGEAGCVPPAHSLIADYFTRAERPRASSLYQQGVSLGGIIAYFVAGWVTQFYGWRTMFLVLSIPGLVLAVLAFVTIREVGHRSSNGEDRVPVSRGTSGSSPRVVKPDSAVLHPPSMKAVFITLWGNKSFCHVLCGFSMWYFFGYGISQWHPAFFVRSFGLNTGELGTWLAVAFGLGGLIGTYWGGNLASRYACNNERLQLQAMAIVNLAFNGVLWALIYLSHDYRVALVLTGLGTLGGALIYGPLFATIQTLVPPRMRAISIAIVLMCGNLIGLGLGPVAVGAVSDALHPFLGQESLRYALLALCPGYVWVSWHFWRASESVGSDIETALGGAQRTNCSSDWPERPMVDTVGS